MLPVTSGARDKKKSEQSTLPKDISIATTILLRFLACLHTILLHFTQEYIIVRGLIFCCRSQLPRRSTCVRPFALAQALLAHKIKQLRTTGHTRRELLIPRVE